MRGVKRVKGEKWIHRKKGFTFNFKSKIAHTFYYIFTPALLINLKELTAYVEVP